MITATLTVLGKKIKATGDTVDEALAALKVPKGRNKAVLSVSDGKKTIERVLTPPVVYRAFHSHGLNREVGIKKLVTLFI